MKDTERDRQFSILEYLQLKRILAWRNNSGVQFFSRNGKDYAVRSGPKGSPDIVGVLPNGIFFGIEVKKPPNKATKEQEEFHDLIRKNNGIAFVAYDIDDVIEHLKCG